MQINALNSVCNYAGLQKSKKASTNFCAAGAQRNPVLLGVFDPREIIRKENEYKEELVNTFFVTQELPNGKSVKKLDPEIKERLDELEFEFEGPDGEKFSSDVKNAIEAFIQRDEEGFDVIRNLLHGTMCESIDDIIKNGIDPMKCKRTVFGPGFYFAFSEGTAQDYSSAKLEADIKRTQKEDGTKARIVRFDGDFYNKISNCALTTAVNDILGLDVGFDSPYNPFAPDYRRLNSEFISKVVDEYCRDILVNELKIDAGYGNARGYHSCLVVFNPDSIENVRDYSAEQKNRFYY